MITYSQALIMGLLQGVTELFPISSLGHTVILPGLLGWNIQQDNPLFLNFLVATHFATATVLFLFFWRDWVKIIKGIFRSLVSRSIAAGDYYARLGWLLVVGTIPAGLIGLLLEKKLSLLFASPRIAAVFLAFNGLLLYGAEILRKNAPENNKTNNSDQRVARLTWGQSLKIGAAQTIALIPGFSRSGATMAGGLLFGLSHKDALRFSFLLATPIIGAAAVLKLPALFKAENHALLGPAFLGALAAALTAYLSIKFLLRYFQTNKLTPFAVYCLLAGVVSFLVLYFK